MNKNQKGFTLIELLVVIAIIGILASLVLVALGNARAKANDARVKSNISQLRTIAEIVYDSGNSSYLTVSDCFADPTSATATVDCGNATVAGNVDTILTDIDNLGSVLGVGTSTGSAYCVSGRLVSDSTTHFCIDSTGASVTSTAATCDSTDTACL